MYDRQHPQGGRNGGVIDRLARGRPTFDPQVGHTAELHRLATETGTHLAIGYTVKTERGLRNEATVLAPDGKFLGVYGKDFLKLALHITCLLGQIKSEMSHFTL